jgi:hypothetical protein
VFCSNQLGHGRQMDLSGPGIDFKLKEKKEKKTRQLLKVFSKDLTLNWIHSFMEVFFFLLPKSVDIEIIFFHLGFLFCGSVLQDVI